MKDTAPWLTCDVCDGDGGGPYLAGGVWLTCPECEGLGGYWVDETWEPYAIGTGDGGYWVDGIWEPCLVCDGRGSVASNDETEAKTDLAAIELLS